MVATLIVIFYILFLMSYSGSMFVQIGYWLLETYFIDGINNLMFVDSQLNLIRRRQLEEGGEN